MTMARLVNLGIVALSLAAGVITLSFAGISNRSAPPTIEDTPAVAGCIPLELFIDTVKSTMAKAGFTWVITTTVDGQVCVISVERTEP